MADAQVPPAAPRSRKLALSSCDNHVLSSDPRRGHAPLPGCSGATPSRTAARTGTPRGIRCAAAFVNRFRSPCRCWRHKSTVIPCHAPDRRAHPQDARRKRRDPYRTDIDDIVACYGIGLAAVRSKHRRARTIDHRTSTARTSYEPPTGESSRSVLDVER